MFTALLKDINLIISCQINWLMILRRCIKGVAQRFIHEVSKKIKGKYSVPNFGGLLLLFQWSIFLSTTPESRSRFTCLLCLFMSVDVNEIGYLTTRPPDCSIHAFEISIMVLDMKPRQIFTHTGGRGSEI